MPWTYTTGVHEQATTRQFRFEPARQVERHGKAPIPISFQSKTLQEQAQGGTEKAGQVQQPSQNQSEVAQPQESPSEEGQVLKPHSCFFFQEAQNGQSGQEDIQKVTQPRTTEVGQAEERRRDE